MTEPAETEKRPVGRPSEYDPAYCHRVVVLGKEGKSRAEIASDLECSRATLTAWEKAHPEFLTALERAKDEALAWWEGKGRTGIEQGSAFNAGLWGKCMSGRFPAEPYRERVQLTGKDDGPVQHLDLANLSDEQLATLEGILGCGLGAAAQPGADPGGEGPSGG